MKTKTRKYKTTENAKSEMNTTIIFTMNSVF